MVVRARLCTRVDVHCPRPQLLRAHAREVYRGGPIHAWCHVGAAHRFQGVGGDDAHACCFPGVLWCGMGVRVRFRVGARVVIAMTVIMIMSVGV